VLLLLMTTGGGSMAGYGALLRPVHSSANIRRPHGEIPCGEGAARLRTGDGIMVTSVVWTGERRVLRYVAAFAGLVGVICVLTVRLRP